MATTDSFSRVKCLPRMLSDAQVQQPQPRRHCMLGAVSPGNVTLVRENSREESMAERVDSLQFECSSRMLPAPSFLMTENAGLWPTPVWATGLTVSRAGESGAETSPATPSAWESNNYLRRVPSKASPRHNLMSKAGYFYSFTARDSNSLDALQDILLTIKRVFS